MAVRTVVPPVTIRGNHWSKPFYSCGLLLVCQYENQVVVLQVLYVTCTEPPVIGEGKAVMSCECVEKTLNHELQIPSLAEHYDTKCRVAKSAVCTSVALEK